ncbi:Ribosomal protein S6 kinase-like 1 [Camelus dromedarius]|uniref:Ribosomal protein S6 kinase-like 1 n=1 Tax=Camelus dromedarius TaxID=9838 RepID=A0A5N4E0U7_CAMDR|nr:Ribosomal protein S6 kinase-like 1 [Camelus dromedarius]
MEEKPSEEAEKGLLVKEEVTGPSHRAAMSLVACEGHPGPRLEPEPCSRARSQARVYLEQIRNRVAPGGPDVTKRDYLVDAATQIRLALERDVSEDYEAAFNHYQNGVDVLLRGVHVDPNKERCEAVKLKINKYLRRAEEIFNCHLQRTLGSGASPGTGFSSLRLRPIRTLSSALEQLRGCRVVGVIEKVSAASPGPSDWRDLRGEGSGAASGQSPPDLSALPSPQSLSRCPVASRERLTIIPHGVPYMTKLLRYFVSEDSIFLHLEHVQVCAHPSEWPHGMVVLKLEEQVKQWAAETLVALEALHEQGVLCRDLNPRNLLLDQAGHIRLTYFGQWSEVEPQCCREALDNLYSAPGKKGAGWEGRPWVSLCGLSWGTEDDEEMGQVGGISELTEACDWWSFGSLLYELLTGTALSQSHPSGIQPHTQLQLPEWLSRHAASLLTELLQFDPTRRLGAGGGGVNKLKSHPFFSSIQWSKLVG